MSDRLRQLALGLPDTLEAEHQGHRDSRVAGKIFELEG